MKLMNDLFFTDYGLMSIIGIAMMLVGGAAALVVLRHKMRQDGGAGRRYPLDLVTVHDSLFAAPSYHRAS